MSDQLHVATVERHDDLAVVEVSGQLDIDTASLLYQRVTRAMAESPRQVLDLAGVSFCDSTGFNALLRLHRRAVEAGGRLALAAMPYQIGRLLALTGTQEVFNVYDSRAEAVAAAVTRDDGRTV
ncbi:STAS domain-containing protein [Streptomyces sp. SL13]|jgi:anti-sigma B factor antagonist|uniref:Anti-sigma factor antagonist n=1 Tax=Streptantibioticus silvisoli TaxID=2705255 RepID=A0AA90H8S7_9ACTN|nr:STAS domain-containing protein [Streptantibioticus silvisoli]MDI5961360.1 STAS domain-containing protein [Streptantibioticus silvisoli]MDI5973306.1 STAS domain-containing protein [Streptantibioticus silvisoli]